jgi:hypothetical protein
MTQLFYVDAQGNYLGAFDGALPPAGAIEVATAPQDARQKWSGGAWTALSAIPALALATNLAQGITVTSSSAPAIDGIYALDAGMQSDLANIAATIAFTGAFPGGGASFTYPDITGLPVNEKTFPSVAVFKSFYIAYSTLVLQMQQTEATLAGGSQTSWPSQSVTVA